MSRRNVGLRAGTEIVIRMKRSRREMPQLETLPTHPENKWI